jgi:hypothetical protein
MPLSTGFLKKSGFKMKEIYQILKDLVAPFIFQYKKAKLSL